MGLGSVVFQGIEYPRLESVLRLMRIPNKDWPKTFEGVRIMERAAKKVMNDKD